MFDITVATTVSPGSCAGLVQPDGTCRQHLVAVDHVALGVGEERAIGVAVVRDARVGAQPHDLGGHDLGVQRAAAFVDVRSVRRRVDRRHVGPEAPEQVGRDLRRGTVRAVNDHAHAGERRQRGADQMLQVALARVRERQHPTVVGLGDIDGRRSERRLHLVLDRVGELHPVAREELDAVVRGRVVRRADHHAGRGAEVDRHVGDRRRGLDAGQQHIAAGAPDTVDERVLEPLTRVTRIAPDDDHGPGGAVATEHGDGRATEAGGELARELRAREAADAVGAEEPPHRAAPYPSNSASNARTRRSISSRIGRTSAGVRPDGS